MKEEIKEIKERAEDLLNNHDYFNVAGYEELESKYGEALASLLIDIRDAITLAAAYYILTDNKSK